MIAVLLAITIYAQAVLPGDPILPTPPGQIQTGGPPAQTSGGSATVVVQHASPEQIKADARIAGPEGFDATIIETAKGTQLLVKQSLGLPEWILGRDKSVIFDSPDIRSLNDAMRLVGLGLFVICLGLVFLKHLAGPFVAAEVTGLLVAVPTTFFFAIVAWFNQPILDGIIDLAHAFLGAAADAPLTAAITPGLMDIPDQGTLIVAGLARLIYAIVALLLILKVWAQVAWLMILGTAAPIYITITNAPLLGRFGNQWWRAWFGTLVDPILMIIGLKLAASFMVFLAGAPQPAGQFMSIFILLALFITPGWHAGAYGGSGVDWIIGLASYQALRTLRGGHGSYGAPPVLPPPAPPNVPEGVSGHNYGQGGATAASWWKTGRWTPAHP